MTYNFDPDRWFESRLLLLDHRLATGEIDRERYDFELEELNRQLEAMLDRLDGTYQIPASHSD